MKIPNNVRLVVVDVQNDFLPGGTLAVPDGDQVIEPINRLIEACGSQIMITQDSHSQDHSSFSSNRPGSRPFLLSTHGGHLQMMWPDHCVKGTKGWELASGLKRGLAPGIVEKGMDPRYDSYSGFRDDGGTYTGLKGQLQAAEVDTIIVCGLATDYCVKATVLDGMELGYKVILAVDACRGVDMNSGDVERAYCEMAQAGVAFAGVEAIVNPTGRRILPGGGIYEE